MSQNSEPSKIGIAELEDWVRNDDKMTTHKMMNPTDEPELPHPLQNRIVLEKVFAHLFASTEGDVFQGEDYSQRRVCRAWNEELMLSRPITYTCRSATDVEKLLELVANLNSPAPFLRSLSLKYNQLWKVPGTFKLLWNIQETLKCLEIAAIELEYCSLMLLPKLCPGLQMLKLSCTDEYPEINWNELEPFHENWVRPFPNLRELKISRGSLTVAGIKMIMAILERAKLLNRLYIDADSGFGKDDGAEDFGEQLMSNVEVLQKLKYFYFESANCNDFLEGFSRITQKTLCINLHTFTFIQKNGTIFPSISVLNLENALSKLLKEMSHSLKRLTIINSHENGVNEAPVGKLVLPEVMPNLDFICLGNIGLNVGLKASRKGQGFQQFPNLRYFEYWIRIFNDISDEDKKVLFETVLFPYENEGHDVVVPKVNLQTFYIYTKLMLGHERVFQQISQKFKCLRNLMLEMDGVLLHNAVRTLKDLPVENFTLIYYETDNGTKEFDAAITGIPMPICADLVTESQDKDNDLWDVDNISSYKTEFGLADWKTLTRFNVSYRHGGIFDMVFLTFCIQRMNKLQHLELRHFDIMENLLIRMIKKTNMTTITFGNSRVIPLMEDYPVINHNFEIDDLLLKYKKSVKVYFVQNEGAPDINGLPYYAKMLHHFDYDAI